MFIVVRSKRDRIGEIPAYLYSGQSVVGMPEETFPGGSCLLVVDTGSDDRYRAEYVAARLNSGLFGTTLFETRAEADDYIRGRRMIF
jgi:hypothetical protein